MLRGAVDSQMLLAFAVRGVSDALTAAAAKGAGCRPYGVLRKNLRSGCLQEHQAKECCVLQLDVVTPHPRRVCN